MTYKESVASTKLKSHFEKNYKEKIETHIKWNQIASLWGKILFNCVVFSMFFLVAFNVWKLDFLSYISIFLMLGFLASLGVEFLAGWKTSHLDIEEKNVLVYHLLEASKNFEAFETEEKEEFLDKCLKQIQKFGEVLKGILDNSDMPLKLPSINQLEALYDDVMNRIYPAVEDSRDSLTKDGRRFAQFFDSLAEIFFFEERYLELPAIHKSIMKALGDFYEPYTPEEECGTTFLARIKRNLAFRGIVSFLIISAFALFVVYVLRSPHFGTEGYWTYVGDNAAVILSAIFVVWAAIFAFLRKRSQV